MAADEAQEPKQKSGMFKWLIIILLLMILAVGGFIAYKMFLSGPSSPENTSDVPKEEVAESMAASDDTEREMSNEDIILITLPTFLVNLRDPLGRRYLKLTMEVRVADDETQDNIRKYESIIVDKIIMLLSSKTYAEISTMDSKLQLKKDILSEINRIIPHPRAQQVYFTELVIQ